MRHHHHPALALLVATALAALGCGSSSAGSGGSCEVKSALNHSCSDYEVDFPGDAECTAAGGTVVASCPMTDLIGSCAIMTGSSAETIYYYSDMMVTAMEAQSGCTAEAGTWTAQ